MITKVSVRLVCLLILFLFTCAGLGWADPLDELSCTMGPLAGTKIGPRSATGRTARAARAKKNKKKGRKWANKRATEVWQRGNTLRLYEYGAYPRQGTIVLWRNETTNGPYGWPYYLEAAVDGICSATTYLNGGKMGGWMSGYDCRGVNGYREDPYAGCRYFFPYNNGQGYGIDYPCSGGSVGRSGTITIYWRAEQYQKYYPNYGTHLGDVLWCSDQLGCQWYYEFK